MKKSILVIGPFPPPTSGVSLANDVLAKGLENEGWKINTINSEYSKNITSNHGSLSLEKFYFLKTYLFLYKVLFSKIVYITIGQSFFGVVKYAPFLLLSKLTRKKTVAHLHGGHLLNEYNTLSGIRKKIFARLLSMFDYGIVLSESLRIHFTPFIREDRIYNLANFFQKELTADSSEIQSEKDYSELRIVFLSNLIAEKGINILLEAEQKLRKKGLIVKIKLAGNQVKDNNIFELFDISDNIEYIGVVNCEEKRKLLLWSNVFCLPTYYKMEGQPISIIEAMSLGNLILTTDHAGIKDICSEDNAFFCKKRDSDDLAHKIEYLAKNLETVKQKGVHNHQYARDFFSEDKFIKNADAILNRCIS